MSVVHLYCPMARPVGRVLLWTPPEVSVSFHGFSVYFHSFLYIFIHFLFIFIDFLYIFIDFLNILMDFLYSSILFLTPPQGPSKFQKKIWRNFPSKILIKKVIARCRKSVFVPNSSKCAPGADAKIMIFRWIPETWSLQLGEYPGRLVMSGQSW